MAGAMESRLSIIIAVLLCGTLRAQTSAPPAAFDPEGQPVRWEAQTWQVAKEAILRDRIEQFLDAPESSIAARADYELAMDRIIALLPAGIVGARNLDEAFSLLPSADAAPEDSRLCEAIALQVLRAWQTQRQTARLEAAAAFLEGQDSASNSVLLDAARSPAGLSPARVRSEFQSLIVRLFLQRRFRHVLIASAFYRNIFDDADNRLRLDADTRQLFARGSDIPPTMASVESMARAAAMQTQERIAETRSLLDGGRPHAASRRLAAAFAIGEYQPEIGCIPREDRRRLLDVTKAHNRLAAAMAAKDYADIERLAAEMERVAADFDPAPSLAEAGRARDDAARNLERARRAAAEGDARTVDTAVRAAAEIWPTNPDLAGFATETYDADTIRQRAVDEFDRLSAQGEKAQILRQLAKFDAATASDPGRSAKLAAIVEESETIDEALRRARAIRLRGDAAGAWESLQPTLAQHPDNADIKTLSAELAEAGAAAFISSLGKAADLEANGNREQALAIYKDLVRQYPRSRLVKDRLESLQARMPPSSSDPAPSPEADSRGSR